MHRTFISLKKGKSPVISTYRVTVPVADVLQAPFSEPTPENRITQLVLGESFIIGREEGGWWYGSCADGTGSGWVRGDQLAAGAANPTHVISLPLAPVFSAPLQGSETGSLSFGSRIRISGQDGAYARLETGGWVRAEALSAVTSAEADYVGIAQRFLETPYQPHGRSGFGLDSLGLIQLCLLYAGLDPAMATPNPPAGSSRTPVRRPRRGDLAYFGGQVGLVADDGAVIYADPDRHMVVLAPLQGLQACCPVPVSLRDVGT